MVCCPTQGQTDDEASVARSAPKVCKDEPSAWGAAPPEFDGHAKGVELLVRQQGSGGIGGEIADPGGHGRPTV